MHQPLSELTANTISKRTLVQLRYKFPPEDVQRDDGGYKLQLTLWMVANGIHAIERETMDDHGVHTALFTELNAEAVSAWLRTRGFSVVD